MGRPAAATGREIERVGRDAHDDDRARRPGRGSAPSGKAVRNAPERDLGGDERLAVDVDEAPPAPPGRAVEPRVDAGPERREREHERGGEGRERGARLLRSARCAAAAAGRPLTRRGRRSETYGGAGCGARSSLASSCGTSRREASTSAPREEPERGARASGRAARSSRLRGTATTNATDEMPGAQRAALPPASAARRGSRGQRRPGLVARARDAAGGSPVRSTIADQDGRQPCAAAASSRALPDQARDQQQPGAGDEPGHEALGDRPDVAEPEAALVRQGASRTARSARSSSAWRVSIACVENGGIRYGPMRTASAICVGVASISEGATPPVTVPPRASDW